MTEDSKAAKDDTTDDADPLIPPLYLHPNQWFAFEAAGYDMRAFARTSLISLDQPNTEGHNN